MIAIGSDHAGFQYKEQLKTLLDRLGERYQDLGCFSAGTADYPDLGHAVAAAVSAGSVDRGILICGTGIGMSIVANKHRGVRAAVCESVTSARLAREHNDANVLCVGARVIGWETVSDVVTIFLSTAFDGGERHRRRIDKIGSLTGL